MRNKAIVSRNEEDKAVKGEASNEESDTPNNRHRRTRSMAKGTTAATSTDSGTSEPERKKRKKKAVSCEWTDDEVKELESLAKTYGKEWSMFEDMNYIPSKTAAQMTSKWTNVEKNQMKEMNKKKQSYNVWYRRRRGSKRSRTHIRVASYTYLDAQL